MRTIVTNPLDSMERIPIIHNGIEESVSASWWLEMERRRWEERGITAYVIPVIINGTTKYQLEREV